MSSVARASVLAVLVLAAPAEARTVKIQQQLAPELTIAVPDGWRIRETPRVAVLSRGERRIGLFQCPLARSERDMTGRHAARAFGAVALPVRGGTCVAVTGDGARAFARRLRPRLGPASAPPASDAAAEKLARDSRRRTLAMARVTGTASVTAWGHDATLGATFEWDLPGGYRHHVMAFGGSFDEVARTREENRLRNGDQPGCWGFTAEAESDDAFEPRLELQEWNAPPATATSWRVAYAPAEPQPDGSTLVRWSGFVADGEAVIAPDGRLRRVRIEDHRTATGRTAWRTVEIAFTGFPVAITPVRTEPDC